MSVGAGPTVSGIVASAIAAAQADHALPLSPQSQLLLYAGEGAISMALGTNIQDIAMATLRAISDEIGELAGDLLSDVPLVGQIAGFVVDVAETIIGSAEAEAKQQHEYWVNAFPDMYRNYPVKPSAANHQIVPADLFAPCLPGRRDDGSAVPNWSWKEKGAGKRPTIGEALVRVTESIWSSSDYRYAPAKEDLKKTAEEINYAKWHNLMFGDHKTRSGIPSATRRRFRQLRQAIQLQWVPPFASDIADSGLQGFGFGPRFAKGYEWQISRPAYPVDVPRLPFPKRGLVDGGVRLWPVYMDLLAHEADEGRISRAFLDAQVAASFGYKGLTPPPGGGAPIWDLIQAWRATVHPSYKQDVLAMKKMRAEVDAALAAARAKRQPKAKRPIHPLKNVRRPKAPAKAAAVVGAGAGAAALAWYLGFL